VVRDAAVPLPPVGARDPDGEHGRATECAREVGRSGRGNTAVAEPGGGSDDSGPDSADDRLVAGGCSPRERRCHVHALDLPAETRALGDRARQQAALTQGTDGVREPERKRAALQLDVRDPDALAETGARGSQLAVEGAAHHRHPIQLGGELSAFLRVQRRELRRRIGQLDHMCSLPGGQLEPTSQVGVEHVESARAELELPRLAVHEHLVVESDRSGQLLVCDARHAVHLEADEIVVLLQNLGDAPSP